MNFESTLTFGRSNLCSWSPNGRFLAVISAKSRLVLRDAASLDVLRTEVIVSGAGRDDKVDLISFSPDSQFILASDLKNAVTFVFKVGTDKESSTWKAKINEGLAGITDLRWSPDSRHIITLAEFNVKITIWSLVQKLVRYIKFPKRKECVNFSPDGSYLAVIERRENKDCLSLFASSSDWGIARHFEALPDMDSLGLLWSPKSDQIVIYSSKLQCMVCVYSLDGRCLFVYKPDDIGLSLSAVKWSHCGNLLAIATSECLTFINCLTWSVISELEIPITLSERHRNVNCYVEIEKPLVAQDVDLRIARELTRNPVDTEYQVMSERPLQLLNMKNTGYKRIPTVELEFSNDNTYLIAKSMTNHLVWIYRISNLTLDSILLHQKPIVQTSWSPRCEKQLSLMILSNDGSLHFWTPNGAICLSLPPFEKDYGKVKSIQWNPLGKALALTAEEGVICCRVGSK